MKKAGRDPHPRQAEVSDAASAQDAPDEEDEVSVGSDDHGSYDRRCFGERRV